MLTCVLAFAITAAAQAPFLPGAPVLDVVRYDVGLMVPSLSRDAVRGTVRVEFKARQRLDELRLNTEPARIMIDAVRDFRGNALIYGLVPGQPNTYDLSGTTLVVPLPAPLFPGDAAVVTIEYRASAQPASDQYGFFYHPDHLGSRIVTTRSWPYYTRYWIPSNDHPSDAAQFRLAGALSRDVRDPEAMRAFLSVFRRVYESLAFQSTDTRVRYRARYSSMTHSGTSGCAGGFFPSSSAQRCSHDRPRRPMYAS